MIPIGSNIGIKAYFDNIKKPIASEYNVIEYGVGSIKGSLNLSNNDSQLVI